MSKDKEPKKHDDRGSGFVTMVLDHGTGSVRVGYDNVSPTELMQMTAVLERFAEALVKEQERERLREEVRRELQAQEPRETPRKKR
jgi:hypothetical protein